MTSVGQRLQARKGSRGGAPRGEEGGRESGKEMGRETGRHQAAHLLSISSLSLACSCNSPRAGQHRQQGTICGPWRNAERNTGEAKWGARPQSQVGRHGRRAGQTVSIGTNFSGIKKNRRRGHNEQDEMLYFCVTGLLPVISLSYFFCWALSL